eukprot:gene12901-9231_t
MDSVHAEIDEHLQLNMGRSPSVYVSGCRGCGKTSLLMLLAKSFSEKGYKVYFLSSPEFLGIEAATAVESLRLDRTQKVAVLVDEVATKPEAAALLSLLKSPHQNIVTIGAAVPRFLPTGNTALFASVLLMKDLVLTVDDEDFLQLVHYCVNLHVTNQTLTETICTFLLKECGGHAYPTLAFIEYFFTQEEGKKQLTSEETFGRYFYANSFAKGGFYRQLRNRCFDRFSDTNSLQVATRVLGGKECSTDIDALTRLGWWDPDANNFISQFLVNTILSAVRPGMDAGVVYLDANKSPEENTELVIMEGLSAMEDVDFSCWRNPCAVKVESAVSFNWACRAKVRVPNAYLQFQERGISGLVDFYLNSHAESAIEVMLNATQTTLDPASTRQSQDIDSHADRFLSGKYPWTRYVLFNFAWDKNEVVLPRNESLQKRTYTFVRRSNTLYRGATLIKENAAPRLTGGSRSDAAKIIVPRAMRTSRRATETSQSLVSSSIGATMDTTVGGTEDITRDVNEDEDEATNRQLPRQQTRRSQKTRAKHQFHDIADDIDGDATKKTMDSTRKRPPTDVGSAPNPKSPKL